MVKKPKYYKIHTDGHDVSLEPIYSELVPVVHGRWLDCENHNDIEQCSVCGMIYSYPSFYRYNYCPNCGARMEVTADG